MNVKPILIALLFSLVLGICHESSNAQLYPAKLLTEIPESAEILNSPDVRVRASILKKLVVPVPRSCTGEQDLPVDLDREDYEFVVERILELDLMPLNYKEDAYIWGKLEFLIAKFGMHQHLEALTKYLSHPEMYVQAGIIYTLQRLNAKDFDSKLVPLLDSPEKFIRDETLRTLIQFGSKKAVPPLIKLLEHPDHLQRYYALMSLVKVDGVEAGPQIAKLLYDEHLNNRYWALDSLVKLNAKTQSGKIWKFLETNEDQKLNGFAIVALLHLGQENAVPIAIEHLKANVQGSENYFVWKFVDELKPKIIIPTVVSLYQSRGKFFEDAELEKKFRYRLLRVLIDYKAPEAISIFRQNLVEKTAPGYGHGWRPNKEIARILQELDVRDSIDDLIQLFNDCASSLFSSYQHDAGEIAIILAKFGDKKVWPIVINYVEKSDYYQRELVIAELNKHIDANLWNAMQNKKMPLIPANTARYVAELSSRESGIPISLEYTPTKDTVLCRLSDSDETDGTPCAYAHAGTSLLDTVTLIVYQLNYSKRGHYTFILDNGRIRILPVSDAIEWWRKNILIEKSKNA